MAGPRWDELERAIRARDSEAAERVWLELLEQDSGNVDGFPPRQAAWSVTVARCLAGDVSPESLLVVAEAALPADRDGHRCEAFFYTGMLLLLDGKTVGARESMTKSIATGKKTFREYQSAEAVLKRLK